MKDDSQSLDIPNKEPVGGSQDSKIDAEITNLRAATGKLIAETEQIKSRYSKFVQFLTQILPSIVAILSILLAIGQFQTGKQTEQTRKQQEQFHQDELFSKAISQLGSSKPKDRAAAIVELAEYATHSSKDNGSSHQENNNYSSHALTLINLELQTETDPAVLQVSIKALVPLGAPALKVLVENNRLLYDRLARAIGRYLGIQAARNAIRLDGSEINVENLKPNVYWLFFAPRLVRLVRSYDLPQGTRESGLWEDIFLRDARFFQNWDLATNPAYRVVFENTAKTKISPGDKKAAERDFLTSVRDLWINTQAIAEMLKYLNGNLAGANLRRTFLLHPHLSNLDLRGVDIRSSVWLAPVFAGTDLSFANLSGSEMKYADLRNSNLIGANLARVNFGKSPEKDKNTEEIETLTFTVLRFLQSDVDLSGTNLKETADCYLREVNKVKLADLDKQREEVLARTDAQIYLSKIPKILIDD